MKIIKHMLIITTCFITAISSGAPEQGKAPVSFENERWNATPNDINNLMKSAQNLINANYSMEIKTLDELSTDPEQNPVLYYSGHYNFSFSPEQRAKLRKFMLDGGMMIFNTGLGSAPFYRSASKELSLIFPESPLQRLSADHPLFHAYYDVDHVKYSPGVYKTGFKGDEPWIDGVTLNCRTVAIISRFCLAVGWDGGEVRNEYAAYYPESAQKLGVNIFSYATATRAWSKASAAKMKFVDKEETTTDKMCMVQVIYDGEWKTRHAGLSLLLKTFNQKTEIPVKFGLRDLRLSDPKIFDAPLLYITGHENFRLNKSEKELLQKYLLNGGFLLAEACCGRRGFDMAFKEEMRSIMPQNPLKTIPMTSSIFEQPNKIVTCGVTPALANQLGGSTAAKPNLQGIEVNGRYVVVYSPFGMAGGWEVSQSPYAFGYNDTSALALGQNILLYAVTQ
jgi:hypothetical protein